MKTFWMILALLKYLQAVHQDKWAKTILKEKNIYVSFFIFFTIKLFFSRCMNMLIKNIFSFEILWITNSKPSECGQQHTLNIVHAQTAAQQQSNGSYEARMSGKCGEWRD